MASSSNTSEKPGWIKVKNRVCNCGNGKKAAVWVSETRKNQNRLFFGCDACKYFKWWYPDHEEFESIEDFVSNRTCVESTFADDNTQFRVVTANYKKMQRSLAWLKLIVLFHTVLLGICICKTMQL